MMGKQSLLSFTDKGFGPAIVLIHGFCESKEIWTSFSDSLKNKFRVITIDIPGFGKSILTTNEVSIEYYADEIFKTLDTLNLGTFVMVGHSLGGYITLAFEEKFKEKLNGMVIFHSSPFADTDEKRADRNKAILFVEKNGSKAFAQVLIPTLFTSQNLNIYQNEVSDLINSASIINPESIIGALGAMRDRKDRTEVLMTTAKPVLFIVGKEDKGISLEPSLKFCSLPDESLTYILGRTAHMGLIERFSETLEIIKNFMDLCNSKTLDLIHK